MLHGESVSETPEMDTAQTRVLIADDNVDAAESLAILLRLLAGYDVQNAFDGLESIEVAERFMPHAVLLDIGMPRMNGYEVARELRTRDWGADLLLIAVTGWGQDEQRKLTAEAGFDHHFVKPVHPRDLKPVIDAHMQARNVGHPGDG
jgi:DNA-binding response OmpR family regulator